MQGQHRPRPDKYEFRGAWALTGRLSNARCGGRLVGNGLTVTLAGIEVPVLIFGGPRAARAALILARTAAIWHGESSALVDWSTQEATRSWNAAAA